MAPVSEYHDTVNPHRLAPAACRALRRPRPSHRPWAAHDGRRRCGAVRRWSPDFFDDGTPSHGTGVSNIARHYAPNGKFFHIGIFKNPPDEVESSAFHLRNHSYAPLNPDGRDELPVAQSRALRDDSSYGSYAALEVLGAGNPNTPLPDDNPASATPAMLANGFVAHYAQDARGWLHAKSALLVVGAVDYHSTDGSGEWSLSHDDGGHSARAGHARNAFIVAPDDNRGDSFTGTSFAAPRVTGALAILSQKCPNLSSEQLGFILLRSARDLGKPSVDEVYGYGLMDLENAMARAKTLAAEFDRFDSTIPKTTNP